MLDKIDLKRKLCSRKFWLAVAGMVSGLILAFGGDERTAETVCGCIMSVASVIAYVIGEGLADSAGAGGEVIVVEEDSEDDDGMGDVL